MSKAPGLNPDSDVAIIGMALRVPGARDLATFWANLREGVECIRTLTEDELLASGESPERIRDPNYVRAAAELPDMEMFDGEFFGLSPKDSAIMDPQHRQFLECAWEAIEDAGRPPASVKGPTGVFAGCGMGSYFYFHVCSHQDLLDSVGPFLLRHTGNDKDFLSTRASYLFDLKGPSVNVQTACSTSLVAVHYACQSLLGHECDMALAGGVTIELPHRRGYLFQKGEILSPDGHCHAFDHRAAGTVFGSGVGVVVLRRLADALAEGDPIHAVIKATAINNDGADKAGYLAPSVIGQSGAIVEAHELANVSADTIQYVECHGTGTYIGDPIEIEALTQAFRRSTDARQFCRIGSVKTNLGHLDTAAGVVSLIKAALALEQREIPPSLGFEKPNPAIDFDNSPFVVNDRLVAWPATQGPRRAGVNSLGVGGTNAHAVLEEAPQRASSRSDRSDRAELLILTARQKNALEEASLRLADHLEGHPELALTDVAYTLFTGRKHFERRRVFAAHDVGEAVSLLRQPDAGRVHTHTVVHDDASAVFLFPGGGTQYPRMARDLYDAEPEFRSTIDEGLSYLPLEAAREIESLWLDTRADEAEAAERLLQPSFQLPAILILEVALARLWTGFGVKPSALIGHSMGENAAACVAGVLSFRDAVSLVHLRGQLFDRIEGGGMLGVALSRAEVEARLPGDLDLASINAPELCVVSGPRNALDVFRRKLSAEGVGTRPVAIDVAAHSRLLDPILEPFLDFLQRVELRAPTIPLVSNRTGQFLTDAEARDPMYWVRHLRETVRFADGLSTLAADASRVFIEVGPGKVMTSLAKAQGSIRANQVLNTLPHPEDATDDVTYFLTSLGRAYAAGLSVDLGSLFDPETCDKVRLPAYAFQRQRYFLDRLAPRLSGEARPILRKRPNVSEWGYRPTWKLALPEVTAGDPERRSTFLVFIDDAGVGPRLVERLRSLGHRVLTVAPGDTFAKVHESHYVLSPEHGRESYDALVRDLVRTGSAPDQIVHLWLLTVEESVRPGSSFFHMTQERGFYSLFFLAQALGEESALHRTHVTVVANGMQRVGEEQLPHPEKATVLGPAQVIPRELPDLTCRVVDVVLPEARPRLFGGRIRMAVADPFAGKRSMNEAFDRLRESLLEEIVSKPGNEVVAHRDTRRWVRVYRPMSLPDIALGASKLRDRGVYLLTGGLGDLAMVIAEELARRVNARLVLVSRTELPERAHWAEHQHHTGESARASRAIASIERLEALGAEVLPACADVSNVEQMRSVVSAARQRFGAIHGVVHAAGIVKDELVQFKALPDIDEVFTPKIHGTAVLHELFAGSDLDFLVLFSSTSADTAPAGQVDYVAANAYLNAYAESRADSRTRTLALHWGVWNQVGLAARAVRRERGEQPSDRHLRPTRSPFFERWVEDASGVPWLEASLSPRRHWLLDEHRTQDGAALLPGTGYIEIAAQALNEYGESGAFEIGDLLFVQPLHVPDGETRSLRVRLDHGEDGYVFTVKSACGGPENHAFQRHAQAKLRVIPAPPPKSIDVRALYSRCNLRREEAEREALRSSQEHHLRFGARWRLLRSVAIGRLEAMARLELPREFVHDLDDFLLHPALVDLATGFAMELVPGYEPHASLWVPMSYGRVRVHGPIEAQLVSWVRLHEDRESDGAFASFDVIVANPSGRVLLEVDRLLLKRLGAEGLVLAPPSAGGVEYEHIGAVDDGLSPAAARLAAQVEQGILPSEGAEAFIRVLALDDAPQAIVSSMDLELLRSTAQGEERRKGSVFKRPDLDSEYVAPRDEVERTLVGFWEELLGVSKVGVRDSFFDLGGHSLIAVRLFGMVRRTFEVDFPISVLFEAPTVDRCAALIREARQETPCRSPDEPRTHRARFTHLVPMHAGAGRRKTPFFLCAGMFGNVLNLRHLAHLLGTDRPFYGLQARGLYGDQRPHRTFETMARDYLEEVRQVQPRGPYLLGGFSGGGITAYEMATQLRDEGEEVALLVMLDTPLPSQPCLSLRDRVEIQLQRVKREGFQYLTSWTRDRMNWELSRLRARFEEPEPLLADQFHDRAIEAAFRAALTIYELRPYGGRAALFRPRLDIAYELSGRRWLSPTRQFLYEDNGWTTFVRDLAVYEVPGDHDSMVLEPNVRVLAEKLRVCIDKSESDAHGFRAAAE